MANLIITVISIALVAVAALMGAYYGGKAFMDGQVTANANTIVHQAEQIKAAYTLYHANGNSPYDDRGTYVGESSNNLTLTTQYLSASPTIPNNILSRVYSTLGGKWWNEWGYWTGGYIITAHLIADQKLCEKLLKITTKETEIVRTTTYNDLTATDSQNRAIHQRLAQNGFDCYLVDSNNNSIYDKNVDETVFVALMK